MKKRATLDIPPAQAFLGEKLQQLREQAGLSRKEAGKIVKVPEQQIAKYEVGAFVPMATLEALAKGMGGEIPKRIIRRISAAREREKEGSEQEQDVLLALYEEAFE